MAILIGVVALAVLPNIQRSRESKDMQALDSIASAANAAVATTQATGGAIIKVGDTSTGVLDVQNYNASTASEAQKIQHAIFDTVAAGAGKAESDSAKEDANGTAHNILVAYDVKTKHIEVAYSTGNASGTYAAITGASCKYLDGTFKVDNANVSNN